MGSPPEPADHRYLSTSCLHGHHDRCTDKGAQCKFCAASCMCSCHPRHPPDAVIEAGMVALYRARYPEGDGNLETVTRQGREDLHDEAVAVIDAALPHLVDEVVGYAVVNSSGQPLRTFANRRDADNGAARLNGPDSRAWTGPYRVATLRLERTPEQGEQT